jgi:tRNA(Arg) A34 adenosine deaminase TadA
MIKESPYMKEALNIANKCSQNNEVPVGAVIIDNSTENIIASAGNRVEELQDPHAHAEMLAIKKAIVSKGHKWLNGCSIYVTLEPCPMCAQAISLARLDSLYYGAVDYKSGGVDSGPRVLYNNSAHHKPEIYGGIMEDESFKLLTRFFSNKR